MKRRDYLLSVAFSLIVEDREPTTQEMIEGMERRLIDLKRDPDGEAFCFEDWSYVAETEGGST